MGEVDSAKLSRNAAGHTPLGFGLEDLLDSGLLSLADGYFYNSKSGCIIMPSSMLRTGLSSVRVGSLP
jgi:hypothetical protein